MRKLVLLVPLLAGCALLRDAANFQRPTLAFKDARLPRIDFHGAELDLVFAVTNPNSRGLDLANAEYALAIEGKQVLAGKPRNGLIIPAGATTEVTFPATFAWTDIAPAVEALFARESVRYQATGALGVNSPIGVVNVPLSHEGTFAAPKLPQFDLAAPQITNLSLTGARLSLPLRITNPNGFPLPLGGVLGDVEIAGSKVGRVALTEAPAVPAGKQSTVHLPLDVSFLSTGSAVASALRAGSAEVKIDGTVNAAGASLPLKLSRLVEFRR